MKFFKQNYYKIVTAVAILLSILWIIFVNSKPYSDFSYYNNVAKQVANGGQWGDTYTSVGYSIVLGFVYKIFGSGIMVAKVFNLVLTFLSYVILYRLLKKMHISEGRKKFIYTVFVFFPNNIFYNSLLGTEILFTTILLIITLIYFSDVRYKYIIIGILTGINAMIKPFFMVFFFAIILLEVINKRKFLVPLRNGIIVLLLSLITIAPWCYRNTKLVGETTFISNNGGIVLYINNNSQNKLGRWMAASNVENSIVNKKEYIKANATEKNKMLSKAAKKWIIGHPLQFVELGFKRLVNTYLVPDDLNFTFYEAGLSDGIKNILMIIYSLIKYIVFIPAIIIIILSTVKVIIDIINKREIENFKLYGLICFYMVSCTYFITEGQGRYSFPIIFIMIYFFSRIFFRSNRYE
ncbi:Dolichyl-phosphate-mannose-protein mannosyltransferase [Clostridium acidisoli DSM 12555]|uniref:Dolichyl-phosphate-mannose-protein mannosyltransferase n=1 Tax=Clostridium acidisoli DSM 12555 TaxID=1121291 RepID=A0A1W1XGX5_9CLOT|nr:glycosyltransferase family 39 protein [Clostridium acidisoli]SMC23200.1 Dolichyl-phosphate-mannose-protein mannosyltransferase [Clostridium acidisoli DSM 12555]